MTKFKVGDHVRYYGSTEIITGTVKHVRDYPQYDLQMLDLIIDHTNNAVRTDFNSKHCRKLVKKKRQNDCWVVTTEKRGPYGQMAIIFETKERALSFLGVFTIKEASLYELKKMREVKK